MNRTRLRILGIGWFVLSLAFTAAPLAAQDGTVKVYESTFNELAGRIEPLVLTGHYAWGCGFWGCICDSDWTATVTQLSFGITTAQATLTGRVDAQWCGLSFNSTLNTTGDVTYSAGQNAILVTVNPTSIQPCFRILWANVCLPVWITVSDTMNLPPIPVGIAYFGFETARGTDTLRMTPSNISLLKRNGYVELQANVNLW